jgi:hypothetical protein
MTQSAHSTAPHIAGLRTSKKDLDKLKSAERKARNKWTRDYHEYQRMAAAVSDALARLLGGKKLTEKQQERIEKYQSLVKSWPERSTALTEERDQLREQISEIETRRAEFQASLERFREQEAARIREEDEIVRNMFALNEAVVDAIRRREEYAQRNVFSRLLNAEGQPQKARPLESFDKLRRVTPAANVITIVDHEIATRARAEIDRFFDRIREVKDLPPKLKSLWDLCQKLLYRKTSFKVGPGLEFFLTMELDSDDAPELVKAQELLKLCVRSEKTARYAKLWERESTAHAWKAVPQS